MIPVETLVDLTKSAPTQQFTLLPLRVIRSRTATVG